MTEQKLESAYNDLLASFEYILTKVSVPIFMRQNDNITNEELINAVQEQVELGHTFLNLYLERLVNIFQEENER